MKTASQKVQLHGKNLSVKRLSYNTNKRNALELTYSNGREYLIATVNLPDEFIGENEVVIKNYSEGTGVLEALIKAGIISAPVRYSNNNTMFPICELI
jgi:hypothetical protein